MLSESVCLTSLSCQHGFCLGKDQDFSYTEAEITLTAFSYNPAFGTLHLSEFNLMMR